MNQQNNAVDLELKHVGNSMFQSLTLSMNTTDRVGIYWDVLECIYNRSSDCKVISSLWENLEILFYSRVSKLSKMKRQSMQSWTLKMNEYCISNSWLANPGESYWFEIPVGLSRILIGWNQSIFMIMFSTRLNFFRQSYATSWFQTPWLMHP